MNGINQRIPEIRRQTAMGLAELRRLYAKCERKAFRGHDPPDRRATRGGDGFGAAEPGGRGVRAAVAGSREEALLSGDPARRWKLIDYVESERPGVGKSLRPRIGDRNPPAGIHRRIAKDGEVPSGLKDLLRRMPEPAAEQIAGRFSRVGFREDCELLVSMMEVLGPEGAGSSARATSQRQPARGHRHGRHSRADGSGDARDRCCRSA